MANKKINQLVSKTAILSTDLFGIGDATTGQLFKKTIAELQAAIGGAVISVNGLVGTVVLDTDDIQELATPTNKYFTDARARAAISLTVTGNSGASTYSSGTGVLNVPTYTLAGLGGITASFLSGTSGISYNSTTGVISYSGTVYTDASIRALFSGSTGINYNSSTGAISYSGTVYTDSSVRALISMTTTGNSGASTYNNTTGVINVPEYTLAGLGGISLTSLSGGTGITYNNTTGAISYSGTVYTDSSIRGLISLTTTGTSGASTYNSTTGVLNIPNYGSALSGYLPLTGGTLTGALIGTSAVFTSNVTIRPSTGYNAYFQTSGTALRINYLNDALSANISASYRATDYSFQDGSGGSILTLASTGAATFSSSVTATNLYSSGNSGIGTSNAQSITNGISLTIGDSATQHQPYLAFRRNSSGGYWAGISWYDQTTRKSFIEENSDFDLRFGTSNTLRLTIASTGAATFSSSVTVGGQLKINQPTNDIAGGFLCQSNGGANGGMFHNTTSLVVREGGVNTMYFAAGKVGIGIDTPSELLHVSKTGSGTVLLVEAVSGNDAALKLKDQSRSYFVGTSGGSYYIYDQNAALNRLIITSGGNHLLGTTTDNGERLYVSGAIRATGTITANSDITLKKNLLKIENALEKVEQINGYTYEFKEDDSKRHAGVIAQEIQTVLPEIVNKGNDGILGVEYGNISALLIEAIKEQNIKIKNLETLLASK